MTPRWLWVARGQFVASKSPRMQRLSRVAQHVEKKGTENIRPEILAAMGLDKKNDAAE